MKKKISLVLVLSLLLSCFCTQFAYAASWGWAENTATNWEKFGQNETGLRVYSEKTDLTKRRNEVDPGSYVGSDPDTTIYGLIDSNGAVRVPATYTAMEYLGSGLIAVEYLTVFSNNSGVIDTNGRIIQGFDWQYIDLQDGYITYRTYQMDYPIKSMVTDTKGNVIIKKGTYDCGIFHLGDGYFLVGKKYGEDKFRYGIYKAGVGEIVPCVYVNLSQIEDDIIVAVKEGGKTGVIDRNGKTVLPFDYDYIADYEQGLYKIGMFTTQEHRNWYAKTGYTYSGREEMEFGVMNAAGEVLIPCEHDRITIIQNNRIRCDTYLGTTGGGIDSSGAIVLGTENWEYEYIDLDDLIPAKFFDVTSRSYYANAVKWAVENGITSGTSGTTFSPNNTCTRAQILTFLWKANGSPIVSGMNPFTDVKESDYFYNAAKWAYNNGLVEAGTFAGSTPCTRGSTVYYMYKAAGSPSVGRTNAFYDVGINAEYAEAVAWALENGITSGTSATTFSPDNTCTRGQIVSFLYRNYTNR